MRILLVAPQPFFEERGTPIAVRWVLETLCRHGHQVDLLCYPRGETIEEAGLTIHRCGAPRFLGAIPIGFSWKKLVCDLYLFCAMIRLVRNNAYDVIHAGEESVFPAILLGRLKNTKLVYDMDSSMADQLIEKWTWLKPAGFVLNLFERWAVRSVDLVLPVCDRLRDKVLSFKPRGRVCVLHDRAIEPDPRQACDDIRALYGLSGQLLMYVGNLEHYQGVDMLMDALPLVKTSKPWTALIIGGTDEAIRAYRERCANTGLSERLIFAGRRPVTALQGYLNQADVLLSPRIKGVNTPLKVYSYMLAGKPIVATRIESHTQALDDHSALLVEPTPAAYASAISKVLESPDLAAELAARAHERALKCHTREAYEKTLLEAIAPFQRDSEGGNQNPAG